MKQVVTPPMQLAPHEPEDLHFCDRCRDAAVAESRKRKVTVMPSKPCDLCFAQRRKRRAERLLEEGKPTLQHKPFEQLLAGKVAP